jgi:hypothetical protein
MLHEFVKFCVEFYNNFKSEMSKRAIYIIVAGFVATIAFAASLYFAGEKSASYKIVEKQERVNNDTNKILHTRRAEEFAPARETLEQLKEDRERMLRKYSS